MVAQPYKKTGRVSNKTGQVSDRLDKIKEVFYEFPLTSFTVRQIATKTRIPKSTVDNYLKVLKLDKMVNDKNRATNSDYFKIKKTHHYIEKMFKIGLIDYLIEKLSSETIILFGSFRKGESVKESDIDLFVVTHEKQNLNLLRFEKKLKHNIELHMKTGLSQVHGNLLNNIVNGIKLYGSFKVK